MTRLTLKETPAQYRELEIAAEDGTWFWVGWIVITTLIFAASWKTMPPIKLILLPFWLLWGLALIICELKGWTSLIWARNGKELLRVFSNRLEYDATGGTPFDRRNIEIELGPTEVPSIEVLTFGLGDNLIQNRVCVKTARRSLYFGRALSTQEGRRIQEVVGTWLRPSSRAELTPP